MVTPQSGPRETANQTTLEFLTQLRAQIAINAHFFTPWPADGTGYSWVIGLAASDGTVYSAFERNKGYPYQDNLPALNITANNTANVVYQAEGDTPPAMQWIHRWSFTTRCAATNKSSPRGSTLPVRVAGTARSIHVRS